MRRTATIAFTVAIGLGGSTAASAQTSLRTLASSATLEPRHERAAPARDVQTPAPESSTLGDVTVSVYPVLLWVPSARVTTNVPPFPDGPSGPDLPGGSGSSSSSFDGAALAGFSIERARWRFDADGIWAALGTERERPLLKVDVDILYGHVSGGVKFYKDLYVTAGVRRLALQYDIQLADRPQHFVRKPGIWDPLVGVAWHNDLGSRLTLHLVGEGGGFGAGADVDLFGSARADVRLTRHFGLTAGYSLLYLEFGNTVLERTLEVKQTLHGPVLGIGLYF